MFNLFLVAIFSGCLLLKGNSQNVYSTFFQTPDSPLFTCPYKEDLIASIQFLRDEKTTKKGNVESLMDIMKSSSGKVVKRRHKDENKLQSALHMPDVGETSSIDLNATTNSEAESLKTEPTIVQTRVKKILIPLHAPESNNEENVQEMLKQLYEIDEKPPKQIFDQIYTNEMTESKGNIKNELPVQMIINNDQTQENPNYAKNNNMPVFNIPYQRVSDILEESTFLIPEAAYYDDANRRSNAKVKQQTIKSNVHNLNRELKNSITCSESDETVAMLFKPKAISLMQVCDNLLKKITVTVLVPYHVSKIGDV